MVDTPDVETLRRAIRQLGVADVKEEWHQGFAFQLQGYLKAISPLDQLDLSQEEPARVFTNPKG